MWDVDGQPRGVVHELCLDGDTLVVRDACVDAEGRETGASDVRRVAFVTAVHALLNMTAEELEHFGSDRTTRPDVRDQAQRDDDRGDGRGP